MRGTHYRIELCIHLVTNSELPCTSYKINNLEVATATARALKRMIHAQFGDIKVKLWKVSESETGDSMERVEIKVD